MEFFLHHFTHLFEILHFHVNERLGFFMIPQIELSPSNHESAENEADRDQLENMACKSCNMPSACSSEDAETVMKTLGLWNSDEIKSCNKLIDEAYNLLEEKEASMEELEAAFGVFDVNGDGFISAGELRSVMQRLGLEEGMRLEDCRRMIEAYDEDGDGKISLSEFKSTLECAL